MRKTKKYVNMKNMKRFFTWHANYHLTVNNAKMGE